MRHSSFAPLAFLTILGSTALAAAAPADTGWYLASPKAYPSPFHIGTGDMAGMAGKQAVYVMGSTSPAITTWNSGLHYGAMERNISLKAWRGKRVRLSLRLENEGDLRGWTSLYVSRADGSGIRSFPQKTAFGSGGWEDHQFVVDVPTDADNLIVAVGLAGKGKVWVDGLALESVGNDIPVSNTQRVIKAAPPSCGFHPPSDSLADTRYNCGGFPFQTFVSGSLR